MIRVRGRGRAPTSISSTRYAAAPRVDASGVALGAGDGDLVAVRDAPSCRPRSPTTAGMPSSRATMAAWQVRPPRSVTTAAAVFITGSQSGVVVSATSTSPGRKSASCSASADDPGPARSRSGAPTARPVREQRAVRLDDEALHHGRGGGRESTVSGRACTM